MDEEELGLDLSSVPTDEVIHKALLSQLHASPGRETEGDGKEKRKGRMTDG